MDDCKKIIRSILLSSKEGLSLQAMERDYNDIMFERIPLKKLGFQTTRELLAAMPDVANRNYRFGDEIYTAIADKSTVHIANMVSRQRSKKKKNQGGGGGGFRLPAASGGKSRVTSLLGNKYRSINYHHQGSHNMPRPMHYGNIYRAPLMHHPGQGFRFPQPLYNSPHMRMNKPQVFMRPPPPLMNPAPDAAVSLSVPVLKTQITNLLASHSGIRESDMLNLYKKRFNKELNLKANGFSNISELVDILVKRHVAFVSPTYCNAPNRMLYVNLEHIYKHESNAKEILEKLEKLSLKTEIKSPLNNVIIKPTPLINMSTPSVNMPATSVNMPAHSVNMPAPSVNMPAPSVNMPSSSVNQQTQSINRSMLNKKSDILLTYLEKEICEVVDLYEDGVLLSQLYRIYEEHFSKCLQIGAAQNTHSLVIDITCNKNSTFSMIRQNNGDFMLKSLLNINVNIKLSGMLEKLEVEHKDPDAAQKIENIGKVLMRIAEDYPAGTTLVRLEDKYKQYSGMGVDFGLFKSEYDFEQKMMPYVILERGIDSYTRIKPKPKSGIVTTPKRSDFNTSEIQFKKLETFKDIQDKAYRLVEYIQVSLSYIINPIEFFVTLMEHEKERIYLCRTVNNYYSNSNTNDKFIIDIDNYIVGMTCVALNNGNDNHWSRAQIVKICGDNLIEVNFVDNGEFAIIEKRNVKYLRRDFYDKPAFAIRCNLCNVKILPKKDSIADDLIRSIAKEESIYIVVQNCNYNKLGVEVITQFKEHIRCYSDRLYELQLCSREDGTMFKYKIENMPEKPILVRQFRLRNGFKFILIRWRSSLFLTEYNLCMMIYGEEKGIRMLPKIDGMPVPDKTTLYRKDTRNVFEAMLTFRHPGIEIKSDKYRITLYDLITVSEILEFLNTNTLLSKTLRSIHSKFKPNIACWNVEDMLEECSFEENTQSVENISVPEVNSLKVLTELLSFLSIERKSAITALLVKDATDTPYEQLQYIEHEILITRKKLSQKRCTEDGLSQKTILMLREIIKANQKPKKEHI